MNKMMTCVLQRRRITIRHSVRNLQQLMCKGGDKYNDMGQMDGATNTRQFLCKSHSIMNKDCSVVKLLHPPMLGKNVSTNNSLNIAQGQKSTHLLDHLPRKV